MDISKRDELFEKLRKNKAEYKQFCEKSMKLDEDYQKNFPKEGGCGEQVKYNISYKEKLRVLYEEKEKLDSEWKELNSELMDLINE